MYEDLEELFFELERLGSEKEYYKKALQVFSQKEKTQADYRILRFIKTLKLYAVGHYLEVVAEENNIMEEFHNYIDRDLNETYELEKTSNYEEE